MAKRIKHAPEHQAQHGRERENRAEALDVDPAVESPARKFLVTFSPPSPVGPRAGRMEVAANDAAEALAIWRKETGFTGATAVAPIVTEITGGEETPAEE